MRALGKHLILLSFMMILGTSNVAADITGTAYQDLPVKPDTIANGYATKATYGLKDGIEIGIKGVTVTGTDAGGTTATATTADDGTYTLAGLAGAVRVEFTGWSATKPWLKESADGSNENSSVQFVTEGDTDVNFGLHDPADFANENPNVVMSRQIAGEPSDGTATSDDPVVYSFNYQWRGQSDNGEFPNADQSAGHGSMLDAAFKEVGSVWGVAWQRSKKRIFASSFLRRHVGLAGSIGNIYMLDKPSADANATVIQAIDLQGADGGAIDLGSICRGDTAPIAAQQCTPDGNSDHYTVASIAGAAQDYLSYDVDAWTKVATTSYGDIDIQEDKDMLWAVNAKQQALIKVDISSGDTATMVASAKQFLLSGIGAPSCTGGELRPWALTFHHGKGFLGMTCDASTSQDRADLALYVMSFDPNAATPALTHVVSMEKFVYNRGYNGDQLRMMQPWNYDTNNSVASRAHQPLLSDIEFDERDNMILSVMDITVMRQAKANYMPVHDDSTTTVAGTQVAGDIFFVCRESDAGTTYSFDADTEATAGGNHSKIQFSGVDYVIEHNQTIAGIPVCETNVNTTGGETRVGIDNLGEFFYDYAGDNAKEASEGSLALLKGSGEVVATILDPWPGARDGGSYDGQYEQSHGVMYYNIQRGTAGAGYINGGTPADNDESLGHYYSVYKTNSPRTFAKGGGVGDIEVLNDLAPVEIGNRVWVDSDGDGIQDPEEAAIAGVTVELYNETGDTLLASAITDANGHYIFSSAMDTNTTSNKYGISTLQPNTAYIVRVPNVSGGSKQAALAAYGLTSANVNVNVDDTIDSDGVATGVNADAAVLATDIPAYGANNHSFDFGFMPKVSLGSVIWLDANNDGVQDAGEAGIDGLKVTLLDNSGNPVAGVSPVVTSGGGKYFFGGLEDATYKIKVESSTTNLTPYIPSSVQQSNADNDDATDSNIASGDSASGYISAPITLALGSEPHGAAENSSLPSNGDDQDGPDDSSGDKNGNMTLDMGLYELHPAIDIEKYTNDVQADTAAEAVDLNKSDAITWTYVVKNTGDEDLEDINVSDSQSVAVTCPADTLAAGAEMNCTATGTANTPNYENNGSVEANGAITGMTVTDSDLSHYRLLGVWSGNVSEDTDSDTNGDVNMTTVTITLYTDPNGDGNPADGTPVGTVTTDANGNYTFAGLVPGDYVAVETQPTGYLNVKEHDGGTDGDGTDAGLTNTISGHVVAGEEDTENDFVEVLAAPSIDIEKYTNDVQADTAAEAVDLNRSDAITWTYVVKNTGNEDLEDIVVIDSQSVAVTCPFATLAIGAEMNCTATGTANTPNYENNGSVTANSTTTSTVVTDSDLSHYRLLGIWSGNVSEDTNSDTNGDVNMTTVAITLYTDPNGDGDPADGAVAGTTTTDANGNYTFAGLVPGDYVAVETQPTGYLNVKEHDGGTDGDGTDAGLTNTISGHVAAGEEDTENDFVEEKSVSIGSAVFYDYNNNGVQDAGESGISGATVTLYAEDGTTVLATIETNAAGDYFFDELKSGKYIVGVKAPDDAPLSSTGAGTDDQTDSDDNGIQANSGEEAKSMPIELKVGQEPTGESGQGGTQDDAVDSNGDMTVDFGFVPVFDLALIKTLAEGQTSSVTPGSNVTFTITVTNQGTIDATDIQINDYTPTGLILNDSDWTETAGVATLNTAIATLAVGASTTVNITFTVDINFEGNSITNNAEIAAATNALGLSDADSVPASEDGTTQDSIDDDVANATGGDDYDYAEITTLYHIGTHFWVDANSNGKFDDGEKAIGGALVELYDENGTKIAETNTTGDGEYGFDVPEGTYSVRFYIPDTPEYKGYIFDVQESNSNNNENINTAGSNGFTQEVKVGPNSIYNSEALTLDAGINCGCADIASDSGDALGTLSLLLMMLSTVLAGLLFIRREELKVQRCKYRRHWQKNAHSHSENRGDL